MQQIISSPINSRVIGTYSWTDGFIPIKKPSGIRSDEEALRHALWLEHHASTDAGLEFIEDWIDRHLIKGL